MVSASEPDRHHLTSRCAIVGGGPAGMMLGLLLAKAGVDVVVLEKHHDFLRDFRGDTVHPSTLQVMHELGLLKDLLKRPHQELKELSGVIGGHRVKVADFSHLPVVCPFVVLMPQWDFLDCLAGAAKTYANFRLLMETEATDLVAAGGRVGGIRARSPAGALTVSADLIVGADGRHSLMREKASLSRKTFGVPIDAFWMRLSRKPTDGGATFGRIAAGLVFVILDRGEYWQCALVIRKGGADAIRAQGLEAFRALIARVEPMFADRISEIADWQQVKLLSVTVDRLTRWFAPGLLFIGDAAHAMSPIGGVGINLAIQDAVAAANILAAPLQKGAPSLADLAAVQKRREMPTRLTQTVQLMVQDRIISRVLALEHEPRPPFLVRLLDHSSFLRRLPARIVGLGFRPEHVRLPLALPRGNGTGRIPPESDGDHP